MMRPAPGCSIPTCRSGRRSRISSKRSRASGRPDDQGVSPGGGFASYLARATKSRRTPRAILTAIQTQNNPRFAGAPAGRPRTTRSRSRRLWRMLFVAREIGSMSTPLFGSRTLRYLVRSHLGLRISESESKKPSNLIISTYNILTFDGLPCRFGRKTGPRRGNCSGSIRGCAVRRRQAGIGAVEFAAGGRDFVSRRGVHDGTGDASGFPARVRRIASMARRRPVSMTERMSA